MAAAAPEAAKEAASGPAAPPSKHLPSRELPSLFFEDKHGLSDLSDRFALQGIPAPAASQLVSAFSQQALDFQMGSRELVCQCPVPRSGVDFDCAAAGRSVRFEGGRQAGANQKEDEKSAANRFIRYRMSLSVDCIP